jgi:hypothetical protein
MATVGLVTVWFGMSMFALKATSRLRKFMNVMEATGCYEMQIKFTMIFVAIGRHCILWKSENVRESEWLL